MVIQVIQGLIWWEIVQSRVHTHNTLWWVRVHLDLIKSTITSYSEY